MDVRRYNYAAQFGSELDQLMLNIRALLLNGDYVLGRSLRQFEGALGEFLGVKHVCGVNSCTDALTIGLEVLGIGPGNEVITAANTFHATVAAIRNVGANVTLVDADDSSFLMSVEELSQRITSRTRAIIPVHLYGKPVPLQPLRDLVAGRQVAIVEDAAQAIGAKYDGIRVGGGGDIGCFSFHPSKNLAAAGDGGAIVTNDQQIAAQVRRKCNLGQREQGAHEVVGRNSKLDDIQALVLNFKLRHVDRWSLERAAVADQYRTQLASIPVTFQAVNEREVHAYHLFVLRTEERDRLLSFLRDRGIDAVVRYPVPIHLQPAFRDLGWRPGQFPVAERLSRELLCLPIRPDMSDMEIGKVVSAIRDFFGIAA